jgi:anhydro-N-acetylmuramic acid kinase
MLQQQAYASGVSNSEIIATLHRFGHAYYMTKNLSVLGVMSGTSVDGVDFVLCRVSLVGRSQVKIRYVGQAHSAFPTDLEQMLRRAVLQDLKVDELSLLHHHLGRFYAKEVMRHKTTHRWKIDLVGLHGQTVFHQAPDATLQIGEPSYLAQQLKKPVVSDFRVADLAAGGQAAPLAPLFHQVAFGDLAKKAAVAVQNLGGIGNVTYLPKAGKQNKVIAFDTGPASMLIDLAVNKFSSGKKRYDEGGRWAASGLANPTVVKEWMKHLYFAQKPPKSCGREQFGEVFFNQALQDLSQLGVHKPEDRICCFTELTAESIADSYRRLLPSVPATIVLCGGGAHNDYLRQRLQYHLPESRVCTSEDYGWPVSAIEGAAFALLAARRVWEIESDTRTITGARTKIILGKI